MERFKAFFLLPSSTRIQIQPSSSIHEDFGKQMNAKQKMEAKMSSASIFLGCRGDRIRTCDHLVPNQARYRTALHPVRNMGCPIFAAAKLISFYDLCTFCRHYFIIPC